MSTTYEIDRDLKCKIPLRLHVRLQSAIRLAERDGLPYQVRCENCSIWYCAGIRTIARHMQSPATGCSCAAPGNWRQRAGWTGRSGDIAAHTSEVLEPFMDKRVLKQSHGAQWRPELAGDVVDAVVGPCQA